MSQVKQEDVDYDPVAAALAPLLQASEGLPPPMPDTIKEEAAAEDSNATAGEDVMYLQVKEEDGAEGGESWIVLPNSLFQSAENGATQSWYATYGEDGTLHVQTDAIPEQQQQQQEVPSDLMMAEADIKPVPPPTTRPAEVTPTLIRCAFAKCRQVFSTLAALSEHNKTHANFVRRKHNCPLPLCESSFTSLDKLQEHMITHGLKPYACTFEHCKESYRTKADLDYHQRKNPAHKPQNARKKPTAVSRPVTRRTPYDPSSSTSSGVTNRRSSSPSSNSTTTKIRYSPGQ